MTLIIPKFNYSAINRVSENGKRMYLTPDGNKVASVTTILENTKPLEAVLALQNWRNAVGHKKAQEITTAAANRGTRMHSYLEKYILTGQVPDPGTNPYAKISHTMALQIINNGLKHADEIWGSEVALYYPELYAGTTDCVGQWKGKPAILDFKQANKPKTKERIEDYFYQLLFYATAHNKIFNTDIRTGVILMCCQPKVNEKLDIIDGPVYQEFVLEGSEWDYYANKMWDRIAKFYGVG